MSEINEIKTEEQAKKERRRKPYGKLVCIAAVIIIAVSAIYSLFSFLTHGDVDANNPYRTAWLKGLTANGGLYSDTLPQGSKEAIIAATEDENYNLLLEVSLNGENNLRLDYEQDYPLYEALELTSNGKCNVIIQINSGGARAAEEACALLTAVNYKGVLAIQSSDIEVLNWLMENRPAVVRGLVTSDSSKGFEGFCKKNMLLNYKCRPHYAVFDAKIMPTLASDLISKQMPVLASNVSSLDLIKSVGEKADGFILEGFTFEN